MAAQKGRDFLLKMGAVAGTPVTLAGMNTTSMTINNEPVDITNKDSAGWRTLLSDAGTQSCSITASGVFTDSAGEETLRGQAFTGALNTYSLFFGNGDTLEGSFHIASYERTGEHNGAEQYSVTLESSGTLTYTVN